jgi:hypothetical protein
MGGAARDVTPEEPANYLLRRSPHLGHIEEPYKESGRNDVHRISIAVTRYGFIPMKLQYQNANRLFIPVGASVGPDQICSVPPKGD